MTSFRRLGPDTTAYLLLVGTALCWAGNHVTGRWMATDDPPIPPGGLSAIRWALATLVLLPFAWSDIRQDWPRLVERSRLIWFLGLLGGAGFSFLQYYALRYTSAVNVGVMNSVGPAFIILAGMTIFRDRVRLPQLVGISVSLVGVLVIIARGDIAVLGALTFNAGDLIALVNMGIFAIYSACLRLRPQLSGLTFMTVMSAIASIGSVPVMIAESMVGDVIRPTAATAFAVVYTGLFTSVAAYLAWNAGVARLGAQRAGAFLHLVPLFGAGLAMLLLGEEPRLFHALGLLLIVAGVTLAARR
jgi:drug/metabolite transporter (DMT)-like permease